MIAQLNLTKREIEVGSNIAQNHFYCLYLGSHIWSLLTPIHMKI